MRSRLPFVMSMLVLVGTFVACGGGGGGAPPAGATDLRASPAVAYPGAVVTLRPTFAGGTARIEPGVGPVRSGVVYEVGPLTADVRFTLIVTRDGVDETKPVDVPLRYRETVTTVPESPIARTHAGSTLLADGRILQVGGESTTPIFWGNTETFFGRGNRFDPVGELATGRSASTVIALPDGGAMTFGGVISKSSFLLSTLVEQWDPATLAWSARGNLLSTRSRHTASLLAGGRVLIAGGIAAGGPVTERDAELWVPGTGHTSPANEMIRRRAAHTATTMADGRVLLIGGYDLGTGDGIAQCEWFDPATDTFAPGPELLEGRFYHAAVPLADGRVLVIGGEQQGIVLLASAEVFDPATGVFTAAGTMSRARTEVRATRLLDGGVLVAGGLASVGLATSRIETWSPATGAWREWTARLPGGRAGHVLHTLRDGRVVLLGGDDGGGFPSSLCCLID